MSGRMPDPERGGAVPDVSLVVPCYNEVDVIRNTATALVEAFSERRLGLELVLVDNGSSDGTGKVIDELVDEGLPAVKVTVLVNEGYGRGVLEGLRVCRGRFVGFTCADGQVEARDVVRIYEIAAQARTPKLVKVRRRFRMDGMVRKVVSVGYNVLANLLFGGLRSIDLNGNPKILPRASLERMRLTAHDWFLDAEVMLEAKRLGLDVLELNVFAQMREAGRSHVSAGTCWEFVLNLLRYRLRGRR
jgi:glycosyltransferase involved in cell wall biosynthesis